MTRPLAVALSALLALLVAAGGAAWLTDQYKDAKKRAAEAQETVASLRAQLDNTDAGVVTVTQYVDRVRTIEVKGETIVKEIPRYVPAQADAACAIPGGFVRLHDAAATGDQLGAGPGDTDAAPSGVALSAVAETVAGNYTACHANAAQLSALQDLLRAQGATIIGEPAHAEAQ